KVFICNLMTEANESLHMSASDHIKAIYAHARGNIFDYALVNSTPVSPHMLEKYIQEGAEQVEVNAPAIEALGVKCITGNFVEENDFARHATGQLCQELLGLAEFAQSRSAQTSPANGKAMVPWPETA